jgi:hypothetical protein
MTHQVTSVDQIHQLLALAEGIGRVEFKRSCRWPEEEDSRKVQAVLMRLANANPETGGIIELGREDDGSRVGLVDKDLQPVSPRQLAAAEQTLVAVAGRLRPPMQVRWQPLRHDEATETVIILVPGRARSHWYQDERGVTIAGSASHPVVAVPEILRAWALEEADQERQRLATAFRLQIAKLRRQAHGMERMGSAIHNYPHRFDVGTYNQLLPEVCGYLSPSDPIVELLHELPTIAGTINRLMDLSQEERKREFGTWGGAQVDPHFFWSGALRSQAHDLDRQGGLCEERLQQVLGPLGNQSDD